MGAYAEVLDPPFSICDVTYWLNYLSENNDKFSRSEKKYAAINTAGKFNIGGIKAHYSHYRGF